MFTRARARSHAVDRSGTSSLRRRLATVFMLVVLLPALALGETAGVGSSAETDATSAPTFDASTLPPLPSTGSAQQTLTIPPGDFSDPPTGIAASGESSEASIQSGSPPPEPTALGPYDGATVKTITPTLYVNPVTDPEGDPVTYWFRLYTGTESAPGRVHESGWISSTSWKLPDAALQHGQSYTWFAYVSDGTSTTAASWRFTFDIDFRFSDGTSPADGLGVASVELGSGNLSVGAGGPSYPTLGGSIGASFSFDSFAQDSGGLSAEYFQDVNANRLFDDSGAQMNRIDPEINFSWGASTPKFEIGLDNFLVRWTGTLQVPTSGTTWRFGASSSDGVRIWINDTLYRDSWVNQSAVWPPTYGSNVTLPANTPVPIKIEYYEATGDATMKLAARGPGIANDTIVPANWLRPGNAVMPEGWSFNPGTTHLKYSKARINDTSVTLVAASGETYEFKKSGDSFAPPKKDEDALLTTDASTGDLVLHSGGVVYTFRADGQLGSVTTAADDRSPASPEYIYSGSSGRATAVRDPVSGRQMTITYGGGSCPSAPSGFDASAPPGMPCRVSYWDGLETQLFYVGGRFARIANPGGEVTDFGYTNGKLTRIREPLAADAVAAGVRPDDDTTRTLFTYDSSSVRVTSVQLPKPTATASRPQHNYSYNFGTLFNPLNPDTADLDVVGTSGASTFDRRIVLDDRGRVTKDIGLDGTFSTIEWDSKDRQLSTTDPTGRKSTTIYDAQGRPTDVYGPAPASWFGGDRKPVAEHVSDMPHTSTRFDEGYTSLAATYWDNPYLAGPPKCNETGFGNATGAVDKDWGAGAPDCLGATADNWSARFTGQIKFSSELGPHVFQTIADDGVRVWINDQRILNQWTSAGTTESLFVSYPANSVQRIRIDFVDRTGNAKLKLSWKKYLDLLAPYVVVPGSSLFPNYGLPTSSTTDDAQAGALTGATTYVPERGLATATTKDPSGLALTTQTGYEAPGVGYNRRISRTLPAGNSWSYEYYGDTETLSAPPCGIAAGTPQAGFLEKRTGPDPDGAASQTARVEEFVYDAAGRQAGMRIGTGGWSCTTFDTRGRPTTQTYPAVGGQPARTVTSNYAVSGDPLKASISDPIGTISSTADLLGRTISYTDVWDKTTTYTFDQAGRPTSSNGPAGLQEFTYSASTGRPSSQKLDGGTIATPTYNASGELTSVNYPSGGTNKGNGTSLASIGRDPIGRTTTLRWNQSNGSLLTQDDVTRSQSGRVIDQSVDGTDARPGNPNFIYDATGRLTSAWVPGRTTTYSFAPSGGCGSMATAGKNTNRTSMTIDGGSPITYCYDNADKLTQTSDERYPSIAYDERGNTTTLGNEQMVYDGADRHLQTTKNDTTVTYTRDATDRIVARTVTTPDDQAALRSSATDVTPAEPVRPRVDFRSSSTAASPAAGTSSLTIGKPSGVTAGDLMLLHVAVDSGSTLTTVTPPTGWSLTGPDSTATTVRSVVYRRVAGASEPASYAVTFTNAVTGLAVNVQASAGIAAYAGVDTTFPIATTSAAPKTAASATSLTLDAITGTQDGKLVAFFAFRAAGVNPPAGMAERWDLTSAGVAPSTSAVFDQDTENSGSTGSKTATSSSSGAWAGQMIALRPAPTDGAVVFRASQTAQTPLAGASTLTVAKPTGVTVGDLMLLHLAVDSGASFTTMTPPSGWSLTGPDSSSATARSLVYRRVAGASEPASYAFTFKSAVTGVALNVQAAAGIAAYSGVDTTFPVAGASCCSKTAASASSLALDSITGSQGGKLVAFFAFRAAGVNPPSGMSEQWDVTSAGAAPATSAVFDQDTTASGATGAKTASSTNTGSWAGQMVALRAARPAFVVNPSSLSVPKPSGVSEGDFMLLHVSVDRGSSSATVTPPSGWTLESDADSSGARSLVYNKFAGPSEPSTYDVGFSVNLQASAGITSYSDVDRTSPIVEKSPPKTSSSATSLSLDSLSATTGGRLAAFFSFSKPDVAAPGGMTEVWDVTSAGSQPSTSAVFDQQVASPGATGSRTGTSSMSGNWAGQMITLRAAPRFVTLYGFDGGGDSPKFSMDASKTMTERFIGLLGGVIVTKRSSTEVWSYSDNQGSVTATADQTGLKAGTTRRYDPFGEALEGIPDNSDGFFDNGWLGRYQRSVESEAGISTLELGARPYVPGLGRFLQPDPIESGSSNDYDYASGDPCNGIDLTGTKTCKRGVYGYYWEQVGSAYGGRSGVKITIKNGHLTSSGGYFLLRLRPVDGSNGGTFTFNALSNGYSQPFPATIGGYTYIRFRTISKETGEYLEYYRASVTFRSDKQRSPTQYDFFLWIYERVRYFSHWEYYKC